MGAAQAADVVSPDEMSSTEYDVATALTRQGEGSFSAELDPGWFVTGPNGGYLAALLMRAAQSVPAAEGRPPRSMAIHYPQVGVAGAVLLDVEVTRAGRSLVFTTVRMHQSERLLAQAMVALGAGRSDHTFQDVRPPVVAAPEDIAEVPAPAGMSVPIGERFHYRGQAPELFSADNSEFWCWLRLADPRPVDAAVLALMVDALFPAMFFRKGPPHLYPTVDLTVHLRNAVDPGYDDWCLAHVATRTAAQGFIEEDCDLYDRSGALLAQARQLALMVPLASPSPSPSSP